VALSVDAAKSYGSRRPVGPQGQELARTIATVQPNFGAAHATGSGMSIAARAALAAADVIFRGRGHRLGLVAAPADAARAHIFEL